MRWPLLVVLAAATGGPAAAQPSRGGPPRPRPPRAIAIDVTRAIGGFDKSILKRELRRHATSCRQRGAHGVAQLSLMLRDAPGRRGMRVLEAKGDPSLRRCLRQRLPAAPWPTGSLDGITEFRVTVRVPR
ncbi:MAG: hypothetical protein IPH44_33215 [Myxococcales bacterium]|nr:hypothetical protein [Myxococcales bacterium]MBK7197427.1 hypothetical protein [Myxococcales bacterium]